MRIFLATVAVFFCFSSAIAAPVGSDDAEAARIEAVQDRADTWHGRTHYLYDDVYTPMTEGAATTAEQACAMEHIRVKGKDGMTAIVRHNRCD